jgi:predicted ABC-type ATPase
MTVLLHVHRPRRTRDDAARWEEGKHPRADNGQFGSGGGSSDNFNAADYAKSQDDPDATAETIMAKLSPEQRAEVEEIHRKIGEAGQTIEKHRDHVGNYSKERTAIHDMILFEGRKGRDADNPGQTKWYPGILSPDKIRAATPPPGEKPTFTILGGRGGSGKSQFNGSVYDESKAIVLDADVIKHMIEEFQGWNANKVHEESSDILETALKTARELGLNVVLDATMKSSGGSMEKVEGFKNAGYQVEAHYMHLPRHIAAERAVGRYFSPSKRDPSARGRYVPAHVVLGNRLNEANFDQVRQHADKWSFSDNNVPKGEKARVVARGGYDD